MGSSKPPDTAPQLAAELRAPLNAVLGYLQLVLFSRDEPPTERQAVYLAQALRVVETMLTRIEPLAPHKP